MAKQFAAIPPGTKTAGVNDPTHGSTILTGRPFEDAGDAATRGAIGPLPSSGDAGRFAHDFSRLDSGPDPRLALHQGAIQRRKISSDTVLGEDIRNACDKYKPDKAAGFYKNVLLYIAETFECTGVSVLNAPQEVEKKLKDDNVLDEEDLQYIRLNVKTAAEKWISENRLPIGTININMNKVTAAGQLPKDIGNGQRVVGEMINGPTSGGTGFTALGSPVYHNSSGSSSASNAGTVFWIFDGVDTLTVVAMGRHDDNGASDEYLISWTCPEVSVQTTHQTSNRVKLQSTTDKLH